MTVTRRCNAGFTLVEILIVVVILGIMALIVIPQFSDVSETTRSTTTTALLRTLRSQLILYKAQHNGDYPALAQLWGHLTAATDGGGTLDINGKFGPYLTQEPTNQYTLSTTAVIIGAGTANDGWEYDSGTGELLAVGFNEATQAYTAP